MRPQRWFLWLPITNIEDKPKKREALSSNTVTVFECLICIELILALFEKIIKHNTVEAAYLMLWVCFNFLFLIYRKDNQ